MEFPCACFFAICPRMAGLDPAGVGRRRHLAHAFGVALFAAYQRSGAVVSVLPQRC